MNDLEVSTLRLRDGRQLAYAEQGEPEGWPLFYCQGTPSSRLMRPCERITRELGLRLISADRPGFGHSDPKPGRTLLDWARDVEELVDHLGVDHFVVAGASGGGPYVAACAYVLPERVRAAAILGGVGPVDGSGVLRGITWERRIGFWLARHAPGVLSALVRTLRNPGRDPERFYSNYTRHTPPADQRVLARPEVKAMFLSNTIEAGRQGPQAFIDELLLVARPWGFELSAIEQPVAIWHSEDDNSIPIGFGREMARRLRHARTHWLKNEGHLFFADERWRDVVEELRELASGAP